MAVKALAALLDQTVDELIHQADAHTRAVQAEVVPGAGHGMTGEDIPRVNALPLTFLQKYTPPGNSPPGAHE